VKQIFAALALVVSLLVCAVARADGPADDAAVRNRVTCYPFGIDKIGRGDRDGGLAIWRECFAPNFEFSAFIGRGEPTNCPGPSCPFPKDMPAIEMRAAFAKRAFDGGGFVKTSHHLTNLAVSFPGADRATVQRLCAGLALESGQHGRGRAGHMGCRTGPHRRQMADHQGKAGRGWRGRHCTAAGSAARPGGARSARAGALRPTAIAVARADSS
jgi:hypothetical protein